MEVLLKPMSTRATDILVENVRHGEFEGVDRADQAGNNLVRDEIGLFDGGLKIVGQLRFGAAHQHFKAFGKRCR